MAIFGPDAQELVDSSDPVDGPPQPARCSPSRSPNAGGSRTQGRTRKTLVIGNEEWPFPVPLVKDGQRLAVRHRGREGGSAGAAHRPQRAGGDADLPDLRRRAAALRAGRGHDGKPAGLYARRFRSDPGTAERSVLAGRATARSAARWATCSPRPPSRPPPIARSTAGAAAVPRLLLPDPDRAGSRGARRREGLHGQRRARGGFALVAWPAQYDVTGVMTFIVNQDGVVARRTSGPARTRPPGP